MFGPIQVVVFVPTDGVGRLSGSDDIGDRVTIHIRDNQANCIFKILIDSVFGPGQVIIFIPNHNICINCNECSIARKCPSDAFKRVPAEQPYLLRGYDPNKVPLKTRCTR